MSSDDSITVNIHVGDVGGWSLCNYSTIHTSVCIKVNNQFSEKNLLVNVDEYSLKVIVDNLVSNAIKFTNYEESIDLSYKFQEDQILVSITNRGMYFPQSRLKNLFQIDKDTSNPKIEEEKGSGLGLILCKELVSKNGGEFSIDAYEETTKIIFTLNREK